ncbi:MAG: hypothetical protein NVSMB17_04590 [Candidatus Dormibacteria bacterium]
MWQALRAELHPLGLEVVSVALDLRGLEAAGKYLKRAHAEHPALLDQGHRVGELLGVVNVPSGVWVDEDGVIVRPPETAFPEGSVNARPPASFGEIPANLDPYLRDALAETRKIRVNAAGYTQALRDWAEKGSASRYALAPGEVVRRSQSRPLETSQAAAHFELGQHLHLAGAEAAAITHFRAAHRLQPENWTYKREAWSLVRRDQGPSEVYEGDWVSEVRRVGAENYYPPLEL